MKLLQTLFFFLLVTQISFAQWVQVGLNDKSIKDIAVQNSNIFAVTSDSGKLYRSIDNGANWMMIVDSCAVDVAISPTGKVFIVRDSSLSSSGWERSLYSSLDNGETWFWIEVVPNSGWYGELTSISVNPLGYLFLYVFCGGIYHFDRFAMSTDDGSTWIDPPPGDLFGGALFDFRDQQAITYGILGGPTTSGIFFYSSTDYGSTWDSLYFPDPTVENHFLFHLITLGLFTNGDVIIGTEQFSNGTPGDSLYGVYISTDLCSTWTQISKINCKSGLSWSSGSMEGMLVGTDSLGIFMFSDEGDSLGSRNEGLTNLNIQALTLDNNGYVYTGTKNGVWRRPLSEVTPVEENQTSIPSSFNLSQNYPNPFNSTSIIKYSIPKLSKVAIRIFNTIGEEIETLVNEEKLAGTYELTWYAENLPSGVYFYQIRAVDPSTGSGQVFVETKKMVLLR